ncbi:uncharacterized protein LOC124321260 isoform X1 [Daphnia pulicaria]|uniref:uncharacterized protein LOC124321260 isoform X1 n=1 Tax=Daphnia pulicaria TaxID=35523 RepID=UPI001EEB45C4|nr:uncharacterized protein LOC124321260 isoform X1 [Daphnia pulicaria]
MEVSVAFILFFSFPLLSTSFRLSDGEKLNEVSNAFPDRASERVLQLSDFESGTMSPWIDESAADARWNIEDLSTPFDPTQPAPTPPSGTKYLRVNRPTDTSGQAVLRSEQFTVDPGDQLRLSFWIRSDPTQVNNIQVYWSNNGIQERILSLVEYSTPTNFEWRSISVLIPATQSAQTRISIYGFCNSGNSDAVAIDNLVVESSDQTVTPPLSTQSTGSTFSSSTTPLPGSCPSNLGSESVRCETLNGKCYCFSLYKVDSWYIGDSYCRSNGATLLGLETQTEISLIDNYITSASSGLDKYAYWTSGQWGGTGYVWTGSNQPFTATNWYPGQPDDMATGYCVRLFYGTDYAGRWSDIICSGEGYTPFYFICEL